MDIDIPSSISTSQQNYIRKDGRNNLSIQKLCKLIPII